MNFINVKTRIINIKSYYFKTVTHLRNNRKTISKHNLQLKRTGHLSMFCRYFYHDRYKRGATSGSFEEWLTMKQISP